jgi:hypothetical protein
MPGMRNVLVLLILCVTAATAAAEPRTHDGVYARVGVGPGYALATLFAPAAADNASNGADVSTELAFGWAIRPGLVLGGGTFPMVVPAPDYDGMDAGGQHVSATGPFVDYYLRPTGGLHVQGALLFTAGYLDGSSERDSHVGFGYGGMAGVGYDRYVSSTWSLGALVRVTAYRLYGVDDEIRMVSPSLLFTATYQ